MTLSIQRYTGAAAAVGGQIFFPLASLPGLVAADMSSPYSVSLESRIVYALCQLLSSEALQSAPYYSVAVGSAVVPGLADVFNLTYTFSSLYLSLQQGVTSLPQDPAYAYSPTVLADSANSSGAGIGFLIADLDLVDTSSPNAVTYLNGLVNHIVSNITVRAAGIVSGVIQATLPYPLSTVAFTPSLIAVTGFNSGNGVLYTRNAVIQLQIDLDTNNLDYSVRVA